ncbi:MAG: cytochrome P450 [Nitrospiraceae bacterium]
MSPSHGTASSAAVPRPPSDPWRGFFPAFKVDPLRFLESCLAYGDLVYLPYGRLGDWLTGRRDAGSYLVFHPADVRHVLLTNQANYPKREVPSAETALFGQGLLHVEGALHRQRRRIVLPTLGPTHHQRFAELVVAATTEAMGRWCGAPRIDLARAMMELALTIIWQVLFGEALGARGAAAYAAMTAAQEKVSSQYRSLLAQVMPLWVPTTANRAFARAMRELNALCLDGLDRCVAAEGTAHGGPSVAAALVAARDEQGVALDRQALRDELMTLLLAGHETTANALEWMWLVLNDHPDIATRMREEVVRVAPERPLTLADLPALSYTRMVWQEVLRLYPPAWMMHGRRVRDEDQLPSGTRLPAGSDVRLSPYLTHRDPRWFPQPERCVPERWTDGTEAARHAYTYFPFGGGARHCAGEGLAQLEGPLIVATILQRGLLRLVPGQTVIPHPLFTLRPSSPLWMQAQAW